MGRSRRADTDGCSLSADANADGWSLWWLSLLEDLSLAPEAAAP
jgi:hypothetical protein